jgi:hypothetical protein
MRDEGEREKREGRKGKGRKGTCVREGKKKRKEGQKVNDRFALTLKFKYKNDIYTIKLSQYLRNTHTCGETHVSRTQYMGPTLCECVV